MLVYPLVSFNFQFFVVRRNIYLRRARRITGEVIPLDKLSLYQGEIGQKARDLGLLASLGLPVPEGFVITSQGFREYKEEGDIPSQLWESILVRLREVEEKTGRRFGDAEHPLLLSVRSAPPEAMPGILVTILNIGINDSVISGLVERGGGGEEGLYFAYDTYRRFIESFVEGVYPERIQKDYFITLQQEFLDSKGKSDLEYLTGEEMRELVTFYLERLNEEAGIQIPQDPYEQLKIAFRAIYSSWDNRLARAYLEASGMVDESGIEVIVQRMIFGNMNRNSGSGVAYVGYTYDAYKGKLCRKIEVCFKPHTQGPEVMTPREGVKEAVVYADIEGFLERIYPPGTKDIPYDVKQILVSLFDKLEILQPLEVEFTKEDSEVYILQIRPAKELFMEPEYLIAIALKDPVEGLNIFMRSLGKILLKNWPLYRSIEVKLASGSVGGIKFGIGAIRGRICFSLEKAEELLQNGEVPILVTDKSDDRIIEAMVNGGIGGLITLYGNIGFHEGVVASICGVPGLILDGYITPDGRLQEMRYGGEFREGDEVVISGYRMYRLGPESRVIPSQPFEMARNININPSEIAVQVEREYAPLPYREKVAIHHELIQELNEKIKEIVEGHALDLSLEEVLVLNLKAHFLHQMIIEEDSERASSVLEEEEQEGEGTLSEDMEYEIGESRYLVVGPNELYIVLRRFKDPESVIAITGTDEDLSGRYFLWREVTEGEYFSTVEREIESSIDDFLEFAREKLRERGLEDYIRKNRVHCFDDTTHYGHGGEYPFTLAGIDFPRHMLGEVIRLLTEWHNQKERNR